MSWLTLLTTLPPTPTRHRVGVWRKRQRRRVKLIAEIVHEADLNDGKFTRQESTGVDPAAARC